jgi:ABC-type cobalamin/Fe3+-siderophores transport system ATPase subunit
MQNLKLQEKREILDIYNVSVKRDNRFILKEIFFKLNQSEIISILGESGTGKSTFLKIINGLIPISQGKILFKNQNILDYSPNKLRRMICFIPQIPVAIGKSVFEEFKLLKSNRISWY